MAMPHGMVAVAMAKKKAATNAATAAPKKNFEPVENMGCGRSYFVT